MATQKGRNWSSGDIVTAANLSSIERGVSAVAEEYTPTTWANGDTVTAAALNNIEQGIINADGGSSDFSTAQVAVTRVNSPTICMPYLYNGEDSATLAFIMDSDEYTAVLYKGVCVATAINFVDPMITPTINVTGNATVDGPMITITGDCTITISDESSGGSPR